MIHKKLIFVLLLMLVLTGCALQTEDVGASLQAKNGILDVSQPQSINQLVKVNGDWEFFWNQLITPEEFKKGNPPLTGFIRLPDNWDAFKVDGKELPRTGYATFRVTLILDDPEELKGLLVPVMYSNYKLWVDGKLLAASGKVGTDPLSSVPQKLSQVVYFQPKSDQMQMVLQISNYHNFKGGMWEPILYGPSSAIQASHDRNMVFEAILLGVLSMAGIYHVGLSFYRKKDMSTLYFGLFCLIVALRDLMVGNVFLTKIAPDIPWEPAMKLEYICMYLTVPIMAAFLSKLFPTEISSYFVKISVSLSSLYIIFTLLFKANVYFQILLVFQIFMVLSLAYALISLIVATFRKKEGGLFALIGFLILIIAVLFDIFGFVLSYSEFNLNSLGVTAFTICFSLVLSKKLSTAFHTTENLAAQLAEMNDSLEAKVGERTAELAQTNGMLEALNGQLREWSITDGLTNIYNRRHLDNELIQQFAKCQAEKAPIALLLIDIDYFKLYNDTYGHQQGDQCLREVARALTSTLLTSRGLLARYGGEEFGVLLFGSHETDLVAIAQALCDAVKRLNIPHTGSKAADCVTVSIGGDSVIPEQGMKADELVALADKHLYEAKTRGRNQVYCG
ncbi:diguanylate cyclase [Paenibacillus sp. SI8]|uniref:diguanylate cyclase n=1 Tax=unclassified Paenibacillus TaxID=185978 RepID=UPI003467CB54